MQLNIPEVIPKERVEHHLEYEDLVCPQCGVTMTEIGTEVVNRLKIIPAQTIAEQHVYYTYACKSCSESADEGCETPVVKAPREKNIIPGSFATPEAIAHIMTQKFVMGSPLYRQDITVVGCWAHARRKFDEAVKSLPKGKVKGSSASQGLAYCNLLLGIEQGIADKTAEERYDERLEQAKPVLDAMFAWANTRTAAPKSAPGKAFHYLKEQRPYLTDYLKDGRLEISNNRAERSIKPFVIDRKNFLFANTPKGATGSAITFNLIQTAIENGPDSYKYLTWLLKTANNVDLTDAQAVQNLLPWNVPAECRVKQIAMPTPSLISEPAFYLCKNLLIGGASAYQENVVRFDAYRIISPKPSYGNHRTALICIRQLNLNFRRQDN